jgi:hypothetical protein
MRLDDEFGHLLSSGSDAVSRSRAAALIMPYAPPLATRGHEEYTALPKLRYGDCSSAISGGISGPGPMPSSSPSPRILCPNGHLGLAPINTASFRSGLDCAPDLICADSGSCDVGPGPLGADVSTSPLQWQKHDLEPLRRSPGHELCVVV